MAEYISEHDLQPDVIEARLDNGTLKPWRRDPAGVLWFKRIPSVIHATPSGPVEFSLDSSDDIHGQDDDDLDAVASDDTGNDTDDDEGFDDDDVDV